MPKAVIDDYLIDIVSVFPAEYEYTEQFSLSYMI